MSTEPGGGRPAVRPAVPADEPAWRAMWRDFTQSGPEPCAPDAADALWRGIMQADNPLQCLIATDAAGAPVGFAVYLAHPYTWSTRQVCYLLDLYVRPQARGKGHGHALIDGLAAIGRAAGWRRIYWMTQSDNAEAQALYDKVARRSPLVRYDLDLAAP